MKLTLDLHVHSDASFDGRMSVRQIALLAKARGIDGVAICDHDVVYTGPTEVEGPPLAGYSRSRRWQKAQISRLCSSSSKFTPSPGPTTFSCTMGSASYRAMAEYFAM